MQRSSQFLLHWRLSARIGCSLPAQAIQPLGRLDGSGATSLFTSYLATSGSWALGSHTLPSFPPCVALIQGSDGVTAALQSRNFTIACAPDHALRVLRCSNLKLLRCQAYHASAWPFHAVTHRLRLV